MEPHNAKRYIVSAASLLAMALGLALAARANLGAAAILCPVYVLSAMPGQRLTLGMLCCIMLLILMAVECILRKTCRGLRLGEQAATLALFGVFLDLGLCATLPLQWDGSPAGTAASAIQMLLGTALAGAGYAIHLRADVLLSADALALAFAKVLGRRFPAVRMCCDIAAAAVALAFCLFYFGAVRLDMIGPGTLVSVLGAWAIARRCEAPPPWLMRVLPGEADRGLARQAADAVAKEADGLPLVITIARTHGSGGHEIGKMVAERLGIKFYDKEIISATASKMGIPPDKLQAMEQQYSIRHLGRDGAIFETQSQIIRDASRESCVIIGRCADYVLRDRPYCLNIFVRCDEDFAVTMIRNKDNLGEEQAREVIRLKNNTREKHYSHYTGRKWQDPGHYDLVLNTAKVGIELAAGIICNAVENILREDKA